MLGLLAIMRVSTQARFSELNWQKQRLERMILEQQTRHSELLRERRQLTSDERLNKVAAQEGMVAPASVKPIDVDHLPPTRVYWELPDENGNTGPLGGQQLGQTSSPPTRSNTP